MKVKLAGPTRVTEIGVQTHHSNANQYTTSLRLQYSNDTIEWLDHLDVDENIMVSRLVLSIFFK